jgi:prophage regulatory protein
MPIENRFPESQALCDDSSLMRRKQVEQQCGYSRSTIYLRIAQGLFPAAVRLGARAVAWPSREVRAVNAARIAGKSDSDIRALVVQLATARTVSHG